MDTLTNLLRALRERQIEHEAATIRGTDADVPDSAWGCELIRRDAERRAGMDRRVTPREAQERRLSTVQGGHHPGGTVLTAWVDA